MALSTTLEISEKKQSMTDSLMDYRNSLIAKSYRLVAEGKSVLEIAKELRRISIAPEARKYQLPILNAVFSEAKTAKRQIPKPKKDEDVYIPVFSWFERTHAANRISSMSVYPSANDYERALKNEEIRKLMELEVGNEKPVFFLVSKHGDCAEDHEEWQGKLYYDRFWRNKVEDKGKRKEINEIISSQGLKSFQWAINKPVWLITRPNCRHYFVGVAASEAKKGAETLLSEYDMISSVGQRGNKQTIRHSIGQSWYTEANVTSILKQYEDRLSLHEKMNEEAKCEDLSRAIEKDKLLVKKWRYYLRNHSFVG